MLALSAGALSTLFWIPEEDLGRGYFQLNALIVLSLLALTLVVCACGDDTSNDPNDLDSDASGDVHVTDTNGSDTASTDTAGVDVGIYYDPPLHRHELAEYCRVSGELAEAERAGREILTLPIHAALPFAEAERIGAIVGRHFA